MSTIVTRAFNSTGKTFNYNTFFGFQSNPSNLIVTKSVTSFSYFANCALYLNNIQIPPKSKIEKVELTINYFSTLPFLISFYAKNESTPASPTGINDWTQTWNKTPKKLINFDDVSFETKAVDLTEIFQFIVDKEDWYGLGNILLAIDYDDLTDDTDAFFVISGYNSPNFPSISIQYSEVPSDFEPYFNPISGSGIDAIDLGIDSSSGVSSIYTRGIAKGLGSESVLSSSGNNPLNSCSDPLLIKGGTFSCSPNVFVNGIGVVRANDLVAPHPKTGCQIDDSTLKTFSSTVFVNGLGLGRKGDKYINNDATETNEILGGSLNVFAG